MNPGAFGKAALEPSASGETFSGTRGFWEEAVLELEASEGSCSGNQGPLEEAVLELEAEAEAFRYFDCF